MALTEDLMVKIGVDAGDASKSLSNLSKSLGQVSESEEQVIKSNEDLGKSVNGLKINIVALNQGLDLAKKAYGALTGPIKAATALFIEQDKQEQQLANTLKVLGEFTEAAFTDFKQFASGLQEISTVGDETTLQLISMAKAQGLSNEATKKLIKTSVDLGAATDKDVNTTFRSLLQTYSGSVGLLGRMGAEFKGLTEAELKAGVAIDIAAKKFDGFAQVEAKTLAGSLTQMSNAFGDLQEQIGQTFSELINLPGIVRVLTDAIMLMQTAVINLRNGGLEKLSKAVLSLGVSFTILFAIMKRAAIQAFIAKIIAMTVAMWAQVTATLASRAAILAMGQAALIASVKLLAVVASVTAIVVAVDILIANWHQLGVVWDLVSNAIIFGFLKVGETVAKGIDFIVTKVLELSEAMNKMNLVSDGVVESVRNISTQSKGSLELFAKNLDEVGDKGQEALDKLEPGTLIPAFKSMTSIFEANAGAASGGEKAAEGAAKALAKMGKESKAAGKAAEEAAKKFEAMSKMAQEIADQNIAMAFDIASMLATDTEKVQLKLAQDMMALDIKKQELKAQKGLTKEQAIVNKAALEFLNIRGNLIGEKARLEILALQVEKLEEQKKVAEDLLAGNRMMVSLIQGANDTEIQAIDRKLALELKLLDKKAKELKDSQNLTAEAENQLDVRRKLLRLQAVEDKKASRQKFKEAGEKPLFDTGQLTTITSALGESTGAMAGAASGMAAAGMGMIGAAGMILDAGTSMLNAIPGLFDKASKFVNTLTDFGTTMAESIENFMDSLIRFAEEFIPNLINGISRILDAIVDGMPQITQGILDTFKELPKMLMKFMDRLPDLFQRLIEDFVEAIPTIIVAFIEMIIENLPNLVAAYFKLWPKLALALVKGIIRGLRKFFANIGVIKMDTGAIDKITEKFNEGVKALTEKATNVASKVFQVLELDEGGKGLEAAKNAEKQAKEVLKKMVSWIMKLIELWRKLWKWINEKIIQPFTKVWRKLWKFIKKVLTVAAEALQVVFDFVQIVFEAFTEAIELAWETIGTIFNEFISGVNKAWSWFNENVVKEFAKGLQIAFDSIKTTFTDFITDFGTAITDLATTFTDGATGLMDFITDFGTAVDEAGGKIAEGWKTAMGEMTDFVKGLGGKIAEGWKDKMGNLPNTIKNIGGDIALGWKDKMGNLPNTIKDIGGDIALGWKDKMGNLPNTIAGFGADMAYGFRDKFNDLVSGMGKKFAQIFSDNISLPSVGGGGGGGFLGTGIGAFGGLAANLPMFAGGGLVPGSAVTPGNSFRNDRIPALLSPNEVVIPRSVTQDSAMMSLAMALARGQLSKFQAGGLVLPQGAATRGLTSPASQGSQGATNNITQNIEIDMSVDVSAENLDSSFVRDKLIPVVKDALRQASVQGELLINEKGVFA